MTIVTATPSSNSGSGFTNPTYAYAQDSNYATSGSDAQTHKYAGYGFALVAGAAISKVRINVRAKCATNDSIKVELSTDGGSTFLATSNTPTLSTSIADHWVDATTWTTWTPSLVNSNKIWARVTHVKSGTVDTVSLDYLPIEITYTTIYTFTTITKSGSNIIPVKNTIYNRGPHFAGN